MSPVTDGNGPLIDCRSVWKVFGKKSDAAIRAIAERGLGKTEVLKEFGCVVGVANVSLTLNKGEIFCIMGLSGSGKSTLIRLFNRLIEPSLGKIFVRGNDIAAMNSEQLRETRARHVGMVFQNVALLPHRTVLENAAFGLEVQKVDKAKRLETAKDALAKVGLADWGNRFPNELSGGMQQRVGLARALAADPEIILMDEPFSALDPLIRRQLQDQFRQLSKELGKSAIFITHDLDEAIRIGDRIGIMKDGAIIQVGTAEDIVLKPGRCLRGRLRRGHLAAAPREGPFRHVSDRRLSRRPPRPGPGEPRPYVGGRRRRRADPDHPRRQAGGDRGRRERRHRRRGHAAQPAAGREGQGTGRGDRPLRRGPNRSGRIEPWTSRT